MESFVGCLVWGEGSPQTPVDALPEALVHDQTDSDS